MSETGPTPEIPVQPITEIKRLEIEAPSIQEAHRQLGATHTEQIHTFISSSLKGLSPAEIAEKISFSRKCKTNMEANLVRNTTDSPYAGQLRAAYDEYTSSLQAWGEGARLAEFADSYGNGELKEVDGQPVTSDDLAFFCQDDMTGCQTGMFRLQNGSVIIWHTEEDYDNTVKEAEVVTFRVQNEDEMSFFNYPYVLPGGALLYTKDYSQVTDFLYLKEAEGPNSLANSAAWLVQRLRKTVPAEEVVKALTPYIDGYALNIAHAKGGTIDVQKILFAGDAIQRTTLSDEAGDGTFQHNMISPGDLRKPIGKFHDNPYFERRFFNRREYISQRALSAFREMESDESISQNSHDKLSRFARLLSFTVGRGEPPSKTRPPGYVPDMADKNDPEKNYSYTSEWIKASSVTLLSPQGVETWFIPGKLGKKDAWQIKASTTPEQLPPNIYIDKKS